MVVTTIVLDALQFFEALEKINAPLPVLLDKLAKILGGASFYERERERDKEPRVPQKWRSRHLPTPMPLPLPLPVLPPQRIAKVLSNEEQAKKDFLAQLNKLTVNNDAIIIKNLKTIYKPEYLEIYVRGLWNFMLRQSDFQHLHMQVLNIFPRTETMAIFKTIYAEEAAMPIPQLTTDPNVNYDLFCDYVKWKSRRQAAATGWMRLILADCLAMTPAELLDDILKSAIPIDCIIEQLSTVLTLLPSIWRKQVNAQVAAACLVFRGVARDRCKFKLLDLEDMVNTPICAPVYKAPGARKG